MSDSVKFVSKNPRLAGTELTIAVGDRVRFHPTGRQVSYLAKVIALEAARIRVRIECSFSAGNTNVHRWRKGIRVHVKLDEIHEHHARAVPRGST